LVIAGLPIFFLELYIGQYAGLGPIKLFGRMAPFMKGLGYGMLIISLLVVIYYNMIIAWTLYYTFAGFTSSLPWEFCGNSNSTVTSMACFNRKQDAACVSDNRENMFWNKTCTAVEKVCANYGYDSISWENATELSEVYGNETETIYRPLCTNQTGSYPVSRIYARVSPSEDYFKRTMLGLESDTSWDNMGGLKWDLVGCLAGAWVIVCLCLLKGVQSSGKVVYFTALFPYLVLTILLIRGATLEGAYKGIIFYVSPTQEKIEALADAKVWAAAATQIFYSLGPSFGGLITLSSYSKFNNNCHSQAIMVAMANCATSVYAGFVIFSIVGFMAHQQDLPVGDVIKSGTGLAFIVYPEAFTQMPVAPLWSFLFFTMLITLGLDSQFTMTETLTTAILDQWPKLRAKKEWVVVSASIACFILGLSICSKGGIFMFDLINAYSAWWSVLIISITEVVLLMYCYGYRRVLEDLKEMGLPIPRILKYYWLTCWMVVTPLALGFILIMTFVQYSPTTSLQRPDVDEANYVFPIGVQLMGWLMAAVSVVIVPVMGCFQLWKINQAKGLTGLDLLRAGFTANEKWGPANAAKKQQNNDSSFDNDAFTYSKYAVEPNHM
jgi:solute carrier family 6 amino acid transporter-like protein 5/7/9/14